MAVPCLLMDSNGHPHQHVLRTFYNLPIDPEEVRALQGSAAIIKA